MHCGHTHTGTIASQTLAGGDFNFKDVLSGLEGDDTMKGGRGKDTANGDSGDDALSGGKGKDAMLGGEGNDSLNGGRRSDELTGGEGNDTFIFANPNQPEKVTDFAEDDILALAKPKSTKQKVLYDDVSGWLVYAEHGALPTRFASPTSAKDLTIDHEDFLVV